jgi:hypothetical protein
MDEGTKKTVQKIPLLTVNAGPRDGEQWIKRLKEEYAALIKVITFFEYIFTLYSLFKLTKNQITIGFN